MFELDKTFVKGMPFILRQVKGEKNDVSKNKLFAFGAIGSTCGSTVLIYSEYCEQYPSEALVANYSHCNLR